MHGHFEKGAWVEDKKNTPTITEMRRLIQPIHGSPPIPIGPNGFQGPPIPIGPTAPQGLEYDMPTALYPIPPIDSRGTVFPTCKQKTPEPITKLSLIDRVRRWFE